MTKNMLDEMRKLIIENRDMLDAIRIRKKVTATVEDLKEDLGISRAAADKMFGNLTSNSDKKDKEEDENKRPIVWRDGRRSLIQSDAGYFLGISIGSAHTRVVVIGLDFELLSRDALVNKFGFTHMQTAGRLEVEESDDFSYSFRTPSDKNIQDGGTVFSKIKELIYNIVTPILEKVDNESEVSFPLMGIGFAVAGPVDYENKVWLVPSRIAGAKSVCVQDLIGYDNYRRTEKRNIFLSIDNNAKAAMVSEYQYLMERDSGRFKDDVGVLYVGTGMSHSAVIGRKLLRGSQNLAGEIGNSRIATIDADGAVSFARTLESCLQDKNFEQYLPYVLNTLNCILGVNQFILIGHSVRDNLDAVRKQMIDRRLDFIVASTQQSCQMIVGRGVPSTSAIGAAMEVYFCMCSSGGNIEDDKINLAREISWKGSRLG